MTLATLVSACAPTVSPQTELAIIQREMAIGIDVAGRQTQCHSRLTQERERLGRLEANWQREKELVEKVLEYRQKLRAGAAPVEGTGSTLERSAAAATKPHEHGEQERTDCRKSRQNQRVSHEPHQ